MKTELKRFYQRAAGMLRHAQPTSPSAHKGRTLITRDHGVGSSDHFQESVILIMIHYCLNSHIICLDK